MSSISTEIRKAIKANPDEHDFFTIAEVTPYSVNVLEAALARRIEEGEEREIAKRAVKLLALNKEL